MEKQNCNEERRLFDQVHAECCQCKVARRKVSEALRRVRCWFNKEFKAEEIIPKEFQDFYPPNEQERVRKLWNKYL